MIVTSANEFVEKASRLPVSGQETAKTVFTVMPVNFSLAEESAEDNLYMNLDVSVNKTQALQQYAGLMNLLRQEGITAIGFAGHPDTPDDVFPNNVFATTNAHSIVGSMLHEIRQKEAGRQDIREFLVGLGKEEVDLSNQSCTAELTGVLVIDHARHIGYIGMTDRVDDAGARAMHEAFGLALTFCFELQDTEYHTNVVMSVLAGRACVICPDAFRNPAVPEAIANFYGQNTVVIDNKQKEAFSGNCIALGDDRVFFSQSGLDALSDQQKQQLLDAGFQLHACELSEIEKAGGSLRCMVAELF